jgi:hypothetical protein
LNQSNFLIKSLVTIGVFVIAEICIASIFSFFIGVHLRFFLLGVVCTYLSLKVQHARIPYLIFALCLSHSVFTSEGWAINTFIGILLYLVMSALREKVNLGSFFSLVCFYFISLFSWDLLRSIIWSMKSARISLIPEMISADILSNLILALITPLLVKLFASVWMSEKSLKV